MEMNEMKKEVMKIAWALKRADARNDFGMCLKLAWQVVKTEDQDARLEMVGFNHWVKGTMDRWYINPKDLGIWVDYYKTGNICNSKYEGASISHRSGGDAICTKVWVERNRASWKGSREWGDVFAEKAQALYDAVA